MIEYLEQIIGSTDQHPFDTSISGEELNRLIQAQIEVN